MGSAGDWIGRSDAIDPQPHRRAGLWLPGPDVDTGWYESFRPRTALFCLQPHRTMTDRCATMASARFTLRSTAPMAAVRRAEATWSGDLTSGSGAVSAVSSGVFSDLPVTWAARTETPEGKTSPEELVAAAHAACYSMAFSGQL